jgi:heat shock protein HslJ
MNRVHKIMIALVCTLLFPGCISSPLNTRNKNISELIGTRWILQSLHGQELLEDTAITLKISEGWFSGSSGCNFYNAKYSTRPKDGIKFDEVSNTEIGCIEPVMEQEEKYIGTFQEATNYSLDGENLVIMDKQGNYLFQYRFLPKFEANPKGLKGKLWRLSYTDSEELGELSAFTLWFDESSFRGTTSCRDYEGTYQTDEDNIHVMRMGMTTWVDCNQGDQISEATYTTLLGNIDQYNVLQDRLELYTVQQDRLIYELVSDE